MIRIYSVCVLVLALFRPELSESQWVRKADAIKKRSEVPSVVYKDKLYTFLGFRDSLLNIESSSEMYDPVLNKWTQLSSIPANKAMTHQGLVLIDDNVWHIGGRLGKNPGPLTYETWIYNITRNTWSKGPDLVDPATKKKLYWAAGGVALIGRTLHLFGGFINTACENDQSSYHLTLDVDKWIANPAKEPEWKNEKAVMPIARNHFSTIVLGGKIYALGGQFGHDCSGGFDRQFAHVYDPEKDTWTQLTPLPAPRSHIEGSTFVMDGKIYILAGQSQNGVNTNKVTIFNPADNNQKGSWTDNADLVLPTKYEGLSAKVIGSTMIFSHGGAGASNFTRNLTYTRSITRTPDNSLGFSSEEKIISLSEGESGTANSLLFTNEGTASYSITSDAGWLSIPQNSQGTTLPNGTELNILANATGLAPGSYQALLTAKSTGTGPAIKSATLEVTLTVLAKSPRLNADSEIVFNAVKGSSGKSRSILLSNAGTSDLVIKSLGIQGTNAKFFSVENVPAFPISITPGNVFVLNIKFAPDAATTGRLQGELIISSNVTSGDRHINLYGLSTNGEQGNLEPPLNDVVNTLGYNINVGGTGLILDTGAAPIGEEVIIKGFKRAGPGNVTMKPVARFSPDALLSFGYYTLNVGVPENKELNKIKLDQEQDLLPETETGIYTFDPGNDVFGFFSGSTDFAKYFIYSDDRFNTGPIKHAVRIYPVRNRQGINVPNNYLLAFEPSNNGDYQDYIFLVSNVRPADTENESIVRINVGGPSIIINNVQWAGCSAVDACNNYVTGGYSFNTPGTITSGLNSNLPNQVFETEWTAGNAVESGTTAFAYNIPVVNGHYFVRLHFAELTQNAYGLRRFDVNVEGDKKALTNFDIYKAANGLNKAIYRDIETDVSDGNLTIDFIAQVGSAKINAIEIIPSGQYQNNILEAENAVLTGPNVKATGSGFSGTGFADYYANSNESIEWTINKSKDGDGTLTFHYSNGSGTNRPLKLEVNGVVVNANMNFPFTTTWNDWRNSDTIAVKLKMGKNKVKLSLTGKGGPNLDYLQWGENIARSNTILEAERALLKYVKNQNNQPGYTGSGFADFIGNFDDYVQWNLVTDRPSRVLLKFRYSNGPASSRPLLLEVNGKVNNSSLEFPSTGSWKNWGIVSQVVALGKGTNTIRLTAIGYSGGNIDHLEWETIDTLISSDQLEAEDAVLNGVVAASNVQGYTGSGFADFINKSDNYIEWTVNTPDAGKMALNFRYANGSAANRPLKLEINGIVVADKMNFESTSSWTTWKYSGIAANLAAGENKIRLTATGFSGPNIDHLKWQKADGSADAVSVDENILSREISVFPNPASSISRIVLKNPLEKTDEINLVDLSGRVHRLNISGNRALQYEIAVDMLPNGIYTVLIRQKRKNYIVKLVVLHK